jgi:hypothetical protein
LAQCLFWLAPFPYAVKKPKPEPNPKAVEHKHSSLFLRFISDEEKEVLWHGHRWQFFSRNPESFDLNISWAAAHPIKGGAG